MEKLIDTKELYTEFNTFEGVVKALNGVSVMVRRGETYGLVGESGCGKSVTVRSMMRIVQSPGRIVDGNILLFFSEQQKRKAIDITKRSEAFMETVRGNEISMIFQEASSSLNPVFSIGFQVGESFYFHRLPEMLEETLRELESELQQQGSSVKNGWKKFQRFMLQKELEVLNHYETRVQEIDYELYDLEDQTDARSEKRKAVLNAQRERVKEKSLLKGVVGRVPILRRYRRRLDKTVRKHVVELLRSLGIPNPANVTSSYPHELSGGMQQRIVIAMALACHPTLLIADEPTSNLDVTIQAQILDLIKELKEKAISSVLFITHDLGVVAEVCDRVSVMYAGDVCESAYVTALFEKPLHPYSQGLLHSVPKEEQAEELSTIPGIVPNLVHPPSGCRFHPRCPEAMDICKEKKPVQIEYEKDHFVSCYLYTEPRT